MPKYHPYSRRALRKLFRQWAQRNGRLIAAVLAATLVMLVLATVLLCATWPWPESRSYVLGAMHVAVVGYVLNFMYSMFLAHEGQAIWHVRGAWGEDNTRDELNRAKRKKLIWGWVDSINLRDGDIDHLVVTRHGGIVAIDSKWRSHDFKDHAEMARSANRLKTRSQAVASTILKSERGTHRASTRPFSVLPAVVIWGAAQKTVPDEASVDGIRFVGGRQLVTWLATLASESIDRDAGRDLIEKLEAFRAASWTQANTAGR